MQVTGIQSDVAFNGNLYFPEKMTPTVSKFKEIAEEQIVSLIKDAPIDLYVREIPAGKSSRIGLKYKVTKENARINMLVYHYLLSEILRNANNKLLLNEVVEFMNKSIAVRNKEVTELKEDFLKIGKEKIFTPRKIGRNSEINTKSKVNYRNHKK